MIATLSAPPSAVSFSGRGILFTDLDGTLLDFDSYCPSPGARSLVEELARDGILTVPITSKTAAEVAEISREVRLAPIAVVEGGAVLLFANGSTAIIGSRREFLVDVLGRLRDEGWPVRGMSDMSIREVADLTGLAGDAVHRAMDRLASEPFLITPLARCSADGLIRRVAELGAGVTRGGRFWHLVGTGIDKGSGVDSVLGILRCGSCVATGAVGDAWNDLAMFERVEYPYFLGNRVPPEHLPSGVHRITEDGPGGFVAAARRFRTACG